MWQQTWNADRPHHIFFVTMSISPFRKIALIVLPCTLVMIVGCQPSQDAALLTASGIGSAADVNRLIDGGAHIESHNHDNNTPLIEAALHDNDETARALIARGAKLNSTDEDKDTPLHFAAGHGSLKVLNVLIGAGAALNALDEDGDTPLFLAAEHGQVECAEALLNAGANPSIANGDKMRPIDIARREEHRDVVKLLDRGPTMPMYNHGQYQSQMNQISPPPPPPPPTPSAPSR